MSTGATRHYVGRFAPSPTGPLHLGSLLAAVASYLDARANGGQWLLRMEDIDPPREIAGSQQSIFRSLRAHGLHWDGDILYQHQRHNAYQQVLETLQRSALVFRCNCSRQQLGQGPYSGHCRNSPPTAAALAAIRLRVEPGVVRFVDLLQGEFVEDVAAVVGDFVLKRKDGLWAYQLAVVTDDMAQGITHVLRGCDLLDSTPRQIYLQQTLSYPTPKYGHLPVLTGPDGQKLSKQNHAPAIDDKHAASNLRRVLELLQQPSPPQTIRAPATILNWASKHWDPKGLAGVKAIAVTQ